MVEVKKKQAACVMSQKVCCFSKMQPIQKKQKNRPLAFFVAAHCFCVFFLRIGKTKGCKVYVVVAHSVDKKIGRFLLVRASLRTKKMDAWWRGEQKTRQDAPSSGVFLKSSPFQRADHILHVSVLL